jgi:hypothetical protein
LSASMSPLANAFTAAWVTSVSGAAQARSSRDDVNAVADDGIVRLGGRANRPRIGQLARKYNPLMKLKRSPSGAPPRDRSAAASANVRVGRQHLLRARPPARFAGRGERYGDRTLNSELRTQN